MSRWKGVRDLVFDGVETVTDLVQRTHEQSSRRWERILEPLPAAGQLARGVNAVQLSSAALTYATIRVVNRSVAKAVSWGTDELLAEADDGPHTPMRGDAQGTLGWWLDHAEGALNGVFGDHLEARGNALDLGMTLRHDGRRVSPDELELDSDCLCVFVHGLSATEWSWAIYAERLWGDPSMCFGKKLQSDLGYAPLYVRYNSGRHVSQNGRALSRLIEEVLRDRPIRKVALVGHSMGGLVARSAAHYAREEEAEWVERLRHVFCIASPHLGAPLEKATNLATGILRGIPAAGARVPAEVLDARSAGIKDLRFGYTTDEEWRDADPDAILEDRRRDIPLIDGVGYYFCAATITTDTSHPLGQLVGDTLVRLPSAVGQSEDPARRIDFRSGQVFGGMSHLTLVNHPAVYEELRRSFEEG